MTTYSRIYVSKQYLRNDFQSLLRVLVFRDYFDGVLCAIVGSLDLVACGEAPSAEQASDLVRMEVVLALLRDLLLIDGAVLVVSG